MLGKRSAPGLHIAVSLLSARGKDLDEACSPQLENECDVLQDHVCVNCLRKLRRLRRVVLAGLVRHEA
jgi:hypothetical protein